MYSTTLISLLHLLIITSATDGNLSYHSFQAKTGDGIIKILNRYHLHDQKCNLEAFCTMNNISRDAALMSGTNYQLPILVFEYNGTSIRSTIDNPDYEKALRIQGYNELMVARGLKSGDYREDHVLWVPYHEVHCTHELKRSSNHIPLFGEKYASYEVISEKLKGKSVYVVAGHGGPDPGALGRKNSNQLCEDEYAYDIALRLYRELLMYGADAHMIIHDRHDGIRDDAILPCDHSETDCTGQEIPLNHLLRLQQRVYRANSLYDESNHADQLFVSIHVDSRGSKQQDVFFCYYPESKSSLRLASTLKDTFGAKYRQYQKNRDYHGELDPRNLYVLKHTKMPSVLIEVGNIQNQFDHKRFLNPINRQALAKWIKDGIISYFE